MTLTRHMRLWITAVLTMAATALVVGVRQAHSNPPLAGITLNALATDGGPDDGGDKGIVVDTDDPAAFDTLLVD